MRCRSTGARTGARSSSTPAAKLAKLVGHPVRLFAYPFGLWSPEAFAHLDDAGYVAAFQLAGKLDRRHPLWTLRRIIVPELAGPRAAGGDQARLLRQRDACAQRIRR